MASVLLVIVGLGALTWGAEWLVKGAARLAASLGVSPLVIGLTLVAFGTSMPELLVSSTAALRGASDISLGNVVGSNIANVGLILGAVGLLFPIRVHERVMRRELPVMVAVSFGTGLLLLNGVLGRAEGALLLAGLLLFTYLSYRASQGATGTPEQAQAQEFEELEGILPGAPIRYPVEVGRVLVGIALLALGARWLVDGATALALAAGVSELVIGLTLVAVGTSLPELATSLVSALRNEDDISVGNVIGSNIFNLLAVLGVTALLRPIPITSAVLRVELPVMIAFSLVLVPILWDRQLARWQGAILLVSYLAFTLWLFIR